MSATAGYKGHQEPNISMKKGKLSRDGTSSADAEDRFTWLVYTVWRIAREENVILRTP